MKHGPFVVTSALSLLLFGALPTFPALRTIFNTLHRKYAVCFSALSLARLERSLQQDCTIHIPLTVLTGRAYTS